MLVSTKKRENYFGCLLQLGSSRPTRIKGWELIVRKILAKCRKTKQNIFWQAKLPKMSKLKERQGECIRDVKKQFRLLSIPNKETRKFPPIFGFCDIQHYWQKSWTSCHWFLKKKKKKKVINKIMLFLCLSESIL